MTTDIYRSDDRIEPVIQKIQDSGKICEENKNHISNFKTYCFAKSLGTKRVLKYLYTLYNIAVRLKKPFDKATRDDIINLVEGIASGDVIEAERMAGKGLVERLRFESFLRTLNEARTILIDLPDYSNTDMRRLSTDLEAVYWIWNELAHSPTKPNIVISFQKELFRGHFFLGKMNKIELKSFEPGTLVDFYEKRFRGTEPFTRDALLLLARMSRGIFRRFLRYITLTLNHHEQATTALPITVDQVHESIPPQLLAQDMDQQLTEIFPKQPDLRIEAVKLLLHLEEHGPITQAEIAELLNLRDYAVSRLLNKLEDNRYIKREKKGLENVVGPAAS